MPNARYKTYNEQQTFLWKINDNKTICLNLINRNECETGEISKMSVVSRMIKDIKKTNKVSELEASIIYKKQLQEIYKWEGKI